MRHYILASGEGAIAEGVIEVDIGAGAWASVAVRMEFNRRYPSLPPRVYDAGPRWTPNPDRHIERDHGFCLWLAHVDVPDVATVAGFREFVLRLIPFLRDQFVFDDLKGRWPGPEWRHGRQAAYAQHIVEALHIRSERTFKRLWPVLLGAPTRADQLCPCGSRLRYDRCHRDEIRHLRWVRRLEVRDDLPSAVRNHLRDAA